MQRNNNIQIENIDEERNEREREKIADIILNILTLNIWINRKIFVKHKWTEQLEQLQKQ